MATGRPETIDAASFRTEAQRRMPGGQLSCLARNGRAAARGRKLNAGIAASRTRRSRCPARSGHHRDPNGCAARNIDNARRSKRTSPQQDHADGTVEIVLSNSSRRPAPPEDRRQRERPAIANFCRPEPGAPLPKAIHPTRIYGEVTLDEVKLQPCSDLRRTRVERDGVALVSSGRGATKPKIVPAFRTRPVHRAGMPQAAPRPWPRSRPRRRRQRLAARRQTSW